MRDRVSDYETEVFLQFRKERGSFCTKMNERCSRLNRLGEMINSVGLDAAIETISEGGDLQPEMASVCLDKIKSVKLENAAPLIRIGQKLFSDDPEVALSLIDAVLCRFGKTSFATMRTMGDSPQLQERRELCTQMIEAYRDTVPDIQYVSRNKGSLGKTANEILSTWERLLN